MFNSQKNDKKNSDIFSHGYKINIFWTISLAARAYFPERFLLDDRGRDELFFFVGFRSEAKTKIKAAKMTTVNKRNGILDPVEMGWVGASASGVKAV